MTDLMSRLIAASIARQGGTVTLNDGTSCRCGFNDRPTTIQTQQPTDGITPPVKQSVQFTLPSTVSVSPQDILTYHGTRYVVDRIIDHGLGDPTYTQVAVADKL